jgi:beta-N-acetylhexosaminidase
MPRPIIIDCLAGKLTADEKALFSEIKPFGFILFKRNCENPNQLKALTDEFREVTGDEDIPILIDQEGGRVARLGPPQWRKSPSAAMIAKIYDDDPDLALTVAEANAFIMASELKEVGINVDCAPVIDLLYEGAHCVIGDRSYGAHWERVTRLGLAVAEGFLSGGVIPMIKHIPGHGRSVVDSHQSLPVVDCSLDVLRASCFKPFKKLNHLPCAMTAHIIYSDIDPTYPATLSKKVIKNIIRDEIGFTSVLISDDISMKALTGTALDNARNSIEAGCDLALYCNASFEERETVLKGLNDISSKDNARLRAEFARGRKKAPNRDQKELLIWLDTVLGSF